jgi:glycosyltransferase involved in cell wall biosynthesis
MRIAYVMQEGVPDVRQANLSGPANHVRQIVRALTRLGHQVRLLLRLDGQIWATDDLIHYRQVQVSRMDGGPRRLIERAVRRMQAEVGLPYFSFFESRRFAAACCQELCGVDLLYERMGWLGLGGSLAARQLRVPHILEANGDLLSELDLLGVRQSRSQRAVAVRLMRRMIRRATHCVATGEGWRRRHIACWGVDPRRVSVVQNGTELVDLLPRDQLGCFAGGARGKTLKVVFVGAFDPWQGLGLMLRGIAKALQGGADVCFTVVGSGREELALKAMAQALGLSDRVVFTGHLPIQGLAHCLAEQDVGLCFYTDRAEYSGLKLLDYKAAGLATIAAGEKGQPDVIEHEVTGLIVPPGDEDALCAALLRLWAHPERAWAMGRRARRDAERRHSWMHTAATLSQLFGSLVEANPQAVCGGFGSPAAAAARLDARH